MFLKKLCNLEICAPERVREREMMETKLAVGMVVLHLLLLAPVAHGCFPAVFNFGDSTSDTGELHASFPMQTVGEFPPSGITWPGRPLARYSDGKLLIDFIADAFGIPHIDPFLQSVNSSFRQGANFAAAGATVRPVTFLSPYSLGIQILQFLDFYKTVFSTTLNPKSRASIVRRLPPLSIFRNALYTIAIGGNDFTWGYVKGFNISKVEEYLPEVAARIMWSVKVLYSVGARNVMVWDMEPHGCLPYILTVFPHTPADEDQYGCNKAYNGAAQRFNALMKAELANLRANLSDPSFNLVLLSTYDIKINLHRNASKYGFKDVSKACCGVPSTYNYNPRVVCGQTRTIDNVTYTSVLCNDPSEYLIWDGVHNTHAGNRYVANQLFTGNYFDVAFPPLTHNCRLNDI